MTPSLITNRFLKVFNIAKKWLEERHPFRVVGGFMSPSHDDYVGHKVVHYIH